MIKVNLYLPLIPKFFQDTVIFLPSFKDQFSLASTNWKYQVIDINKDMFAPEITHWHITIQIYYLGRCFEVSSEYVKGKIT